VTASAAGRVLIDGKGIGDVGRSVLKERRLLSEEGLVVVNMAFDEETGIVVYGPTSYPGGLSSKRRRAICSRMPSVWSLEIVEDVTPDVPNRVDRIRKRIQTALRQYFFYHNRPSAGDSSLSGGDLIIVGFADGRMRTLIRRLDAKQGPQFSE
jgi:mRNA degradation ribonuclease J1/J2